MLLCQTVFWGTEKLKKFVVILSAPFLSLLVANCVKLQQQDSANDLIYVCCSFRFIVTATLLYLQVIAPATISLPVTIQDIQTC